MATIDHTACIHPRTPAGRAACRKLRAGLAANSAAVSTPSVNMVKVQTELIGKIKRRQATEAALRIQPRRSGARVSVDSSTCVQAALHTSRGLCACGHMTGEFRVAA